ncbi:IS630 transposase-related protein [Pleurocapsa sp. PCC 7319]|uniref:IS630 transposase-related protein n=1 Tax=Pleurocapsa sp. PCC 7319 TaxID=118161 RepID=UPI000346CACE|nr:IS630 transposase-related protein [Pleurocapsa sp. PCC 7319]
MAYSLDMRQRALDLLEEGKSKTEISRMLGASRTSILRWEKRALRGELAAIYPKKRGGFRAGSNGFCGSTTLKGLATVHRASNQQIVKPIVMIAKTIEIAKRRYP